MNAEQWKEYRQERWNKMRNIPPAQKIDTTSKIFYSALSCHLDALLMKSKNPDFD